MPTLDELTFTLEAAEHGLTAASIDLLARGLGATGTLGVRMLGDWPVTGGLHLTRSGADMPVDVRASLAGTLRAPSLQIEAMTPVKAKVSMDADLHQHPPRASLQGTWQDAVLDAAAPLVSREGTLRASTRDMSVELHLDTALTGAPGDIRQVTVDTTAKLRSLLTPYPLDAELQWQVQASAQHFSGSGKLAGSIVRMTLDHTLETPFQITTRGSVEPAGLGTRLDLAGEWQALTWPPGEASAPSSPAGSYTVTGALDAMALHLQGTLQRAGGVSDVTLDLTGGAASAAPHAFHGDIRWRAATEIAGEITGTGKVHGDSDRFAFEHDLNGPGHLQTAGAVDLAPAVVMDIRGDFADLRWPLQGEAQATVRSGRFSVGGPLDALAVELDADADTAAVGPVSLRGRASVGPTEARDINLRVGLLDGTVDATGTVSWQGQPGAAITVTATDLNPVRLHPHAQGRISAQVGADVRLAETGPRGTVELRSLQGSLGGYPLQGSGRVTLAEGNFSARDVLLRTGDNTLALSGDVTAALSLDYRLDAPDLSQLWPELGGAVSGEGKVRGTTDAPRVQATLNATGLSTGDTTLASAKLDADLDLSASGPLTLHAEMAGFGAGDKLLVDQARVDLTGSRARHRLEISANTSEGRLAAAARGGLEGERWSGELQELSVLSTPMGDWQLTSATPLAVDAAGADSGEACLASEDARLCVQAKRPGPGRQGVSLRLSKLPVNRFASWLPPELDISGALNASADAERSAENPWEATASVTATPTRLRLQDEAGDSPLELSLDDTRVEMSHGARGSKATISSRVAGDGSVRGEVTLGAAGTSGTPLSGRMDASLPNLSPLAALVPALSGLAGRLDAGVDLAGTAQQPQVAGELRLQDARADVPAAGISLEQTSMTVRAGGDGAFTLSGEAHSGPGSIVLAGQGRVSGNSYSANVTARGENFEAVKLLTMHAFVSPDLALEANTGSLRLTGAVRVPEATLSIKELPPDVVTVSDDETIVGQQRARTASWRDTLDAKVDIILGDKVHISAFGLETDLRGALAVNARGTAPATGRGTLTLEGGTFKAYGQDLQIRRGRLLFAGPLDDPGLDVRAVRDAGEVVAGIALSGTANNMRSAIFSDPSLPQADALSWLLTGRGLSDASSSEGAGMAAAALALGMEGGDQITRQIGATLGLDELSFQSSGDLNESSLLLGKTLAPGLYLRYVLGVLDQEGKVQVEYKLTDHISVEAESGATSQSANILYRLER